MLHLRFHRKVQGSSFVLLFKQGVKVIKMYICQTNQLIFILVFSLVKLKNRA